MANRPTPKLGVKISNYAGVLGLGNQVHDDMTTNVADFPTPVPALATLATQLTTLTNAIATWGPVGNRGSHADLVALRVACKAVYDSLLLLAAYVQNLVDLSLSYPDQTAFILLSGFSVKNAPTPQGVLNAPQDLVQIFADDVPLTTPKLFWKKPIGLLSPGNVKAYGILRRVNGSLTAFDDVGASTKTSFIDETCAINTVYEYKVVALNAYGASPASASIVVTVLS